MYGGELDMDDWTDKLNKLDKEIEHLKSEGDMQSFIEVLETSKKDDDDTEMDEASNKENEPVLDEPVTSEPVDKSATKTVISAEKHQQLILMHTFCKDAIRFIKLIHLAIPTISQLLSSKSKAEVLESMDFLVVAYNYKVKLASEGIKKMLHLIWTKDTSDEGKGIKMKLISCYQNLYLDMDGKLTRKENINNVAKNLIQLTYNTNLAELTSLEQLLSTLMAENKFSGSVIDKLWSVYGFTKGNIQKSQRRGSIIILAMLAKAKTSVVADKIDVLLKIGLGPLGKSDLILAKHTCIALQRLEGTKSKDKGRGVQEGVRFPVNHPIFLRLIDIIETPSKSQEWFSLTEQAINTIYLLCENPEVLCEEIIKDRTKKVFGDRELSPPINEPSSMTDSMLMNYDMSMTQQALPVPKHPVYKDSLELSQLFFMVGHVALKHIVHLEIVESAWKRKKSKIDKEHKMQEGNNTSIEDELEQVGGTADDDIGDAITLIREREMLFGSNSLLSRFGPLLSEVCSRNKVYTDRTLQITSTLSLAKLMYATIRSNIVIALGDMAVCFNTLIDDNITFLYNRLSDPDSFVKKNAVMVLTHLILNGMVKVKGQISEMAKCLEDPDQRIADLAKLFFTELASKDNAIYNNLPDIISNLTSNKSAETRIAEEPFRKIMKFIFSFDFTEKEKQAENIIDKLCQRFLTAEDERSWRDIAYCLSLLPFKSEKSFKKLSEGWPSYQDKIHEESVHKSFLEIITKARFQKTQKPELKSLIDDLEKKIEKQWAPEAEKEKITKKGKESLKQANKAKEDAPKQKKTPVRQAKRKRYIESDSEEDEEELDLPDVEDSSDEAEMEVEEGVEEESEEGEGESEEGEGESEEEGEGTAEEEEAAEEEAAEEGGSDKVAEEAAEGEEVSEKGSEEEESEEGAEEESDEDEEMGVDSMDVDEESDSS
ncbi:non-SMC mitotic condensation complex subunit 1-domain-containing protein [Pilobolus umbonatus]|nr:non-SMC mitotic condensation complex subunit 1-domain-containing protein [Pilobolus umbonatus]